MKKLPIIISIFLFVFTSCNKDDDPIAPIDQLPAATQTGAGTFGCLVNGEPFVDNSDSFNCFYQFIDGGYYFGITGTDEDYDLVDIGIFTNNQQLIEGQTYELLDTTSGNIYGSGYFLNSTSIGMAATTNENNGGTLTITKVDFENFIVAGVFSFNLINPFTGNIMEIREGRFDSQFTQ